MLPIVEHLVIGGALIALAAIGLARAAVYFRRHDDGSERFFSTSLTSVALVGIVVTGAFFVGSAVFELDGAASIVAGAAGIAYVLVVPPLAWRWFGPRSEVVGIGQIAA